MSGPDVAPDSAQDDVAGGKETDPPRFAVTVVVVTYDSGRDIDGFLDSIDALERDLADDLPDRRADGRERELADATPAAVHLRPRLRVVAVDNASSDDTLARVRAHRRAVDIVETGGNLGYAAGINAGTAHVGADELVLVANPDVRFLAGRTAALVAACRDPGVGVAAPRLVGEHGELQWSLRRDPSIGRGLAEATLGGRRAARLGWSEVIVDPEAYTHPGPVDWAAGALLAITPRCRRLVGGWDDSYFLYSEETDYLLRVRDAGLAVHYEPEAVAYHRGGASHVNPFLWSTLATNRVRLYASRHGRMRGRVYLGVVMLNEALRIGGSPTHRAALRSLLARRRELLAIRG